jgi:hypothetical protein
MSANRAQRDALAADLLADLAAEPQVRPEPLSTAPTQPRPRAARPTPAPAPDVAPAPDGPRTRGPALQTVLRFEPFDWYKPLLRVQWLSVSVRVGPVYLSGTVLR